MKQRVLSILLVVLMLVGVIPTISVAADTQPTVISEVEFESHNLDLGYGMMVNYYEFKTVKGAPAYMKNSDINCYLEVLQENGSWNRLYRGAILQEGTYRFYGMVAIDPEIIDQYTFATSINIVINGQLRKEGLITNNPGQTAYIFHTDEFTITKPKEPHTITFDANGGSGRMMPYTFVSGGTPVPETCDFTPPAGCKFVGWKLHPDDQKFVVNTVWVDKDITLYAVWSNNYSIRVGGVELCSGEYLAQGATEPTTQKPEDNYAYFLYENGDYCLTLHNYSYTGTGYCFYDQRSHREAIIHSNVPSGYRLNINYEGTNNLIYNGEMRYSNAIYEQSLGSAYMELAGQEDAVLNIRGARRGINIYTSLYIQSGNINIEASGAGIGTCQQQLRMNGGKLTVVSDEICLSLGCRKETVFSNCEVLLISKSTATGHCAISVSPYGDIYKLQFDSKHIITVATDSAGTQIETYLRDELSTYKYLHLQMPPNIGIYGVQEPAPGYTASKAYKIDFPVGLRVQKVTWLDASGKEFTGTFEKGKTYTFYLQYAPSVGETSSATATVNGKEAKHLYHPIDRVGIIKKEYVCPDYSCDFILKPFYVGHKKTDDIILSTVGDFPCQISKVIWAGEEDTLQAGATETVSLVVTDEDVSLCSFLINGTTPRVSYSALNQVVLRYTFTLPNVQVVLTEDSNPVPGGTVTVDLEQFAQQSEVFMEAYFSDAIQVAWYADDKLIEGATGASYTIPDPCEATKIYGVVTVDNASYSHRPIEFEPTTQVLYGDVDGNGKVEATDALEVLKSVVGKVTLTGSQFTAADTDGNGSADAADALNILKKVVGKINKFPVEQ